MLSQIVPVDFVCMLVEELARTEEVSTVAALDALVRLPLRVVVVNWTATTLRT